MKDKEFEIVYRSKIEDVRHDVREYGAIPIECSIGGESVVCDRFQMDHHNNLSHLEGVAVRAYRDHFGQAKGGLFVVTGNPDADACFAIAALAGVLPHPSRADELEKAPDHVREMLTRDWSDLADLVNRVDCNPLDVDMAEEEHGPKLLLWNAACDFPHDALGFYAGVAMWRRMLAGNRPMDAFEKVALDDDLTRRAMAREDWRESSGRHGKHVLLLGETRVWGYDEWYRTFDEGVPGMIVARHHRNRQLTISCKNDEEARQLFGPDGLKALIKRINDLDDPLLGGYGWGGREAVGGSTRDVAISLEGLKRVGEIAAAMISEYRNGLGSTNEVSRRLAEMGGI